MSGVGLRSQDATITTKLKASTCDRTSTTVKHLPQPIQGGALGGREGLATDRTAIASLPLAMHANVPLAHLPSDRALGIVAELGLRVHRWPPLDATLQARASHVRKDARRTRLFSSHQTLHHGSLGWYPAWTCRSEWVTVAPQGFSGVMASEAGG
jgi:hypothetical protein